MRHRVYGRHLSRDNDSRRALFKSLVRGLILSEAIETTEAKAKSIKGLVDRIVTQAKSASTARLVSQFLTEKVIQEKLFNVIVPKLSQRSSGYTSIVHLGARIGDAAPMVRMSFVTDIVKEEPKKVAKKVKK